MCAYYPSVYSESKRPLRATREAVLDFLQNSFSINHISEKDIQVMLRVWRDNDSVGLRVLVLCPGQEDIEYDGIRFQVLPRLDDPRTAPIVLVIGHYPINSDSLFYGRLKILYLQMWANLGSDFMADWAGEAQKELDDFLQAHPTKPEKEVIDAIRQIEKQSATVTQRTDNPSPKSSPRDCERNTEPPFETFHDEIVLDCNRGDFEKWLKQQYKHIKDYKDTPEGATFAIQFTRFCIKYSRKAGQHRYVFEIKEPNGYSKIREDFIATVRKRFESDAPPPTADPDQESPMTESMRREIEITLNVERVQQRRNNNPNAKAVLERLGTLSQSDNPIDRAIAKTYLIPPSYLEETAGKKLADEITNQFVDALPAPQPTPGRAENPLAPMLLVENSALKTARLAENLIRDNPYLQPIDGAVLETADPAPQPTGHAPYKPPAPPKLPNRKPERQKWIDVWELIRPKVETDNTLTTEDIQEFLTNHSSALAHDLKRDTIGKIMKLGKAGGIPPKD